MPRDAGPGHRDEFLFYSECHGNPMKNVGQDVD